MTHETTTSPPPEASQITRTYRVSHTQEITHWVDIQATDERAAVEKSMTTHKDQWDSVSYTSPSFEVETIW